MSALRRALEVAQEGTKEFRSPASNALGYAEYQETAEALLEAKEAGLVYEAKEERSAARETYRHIKRVLVAGGLTPKGKIALQDFHTPRPVLEPEATTSRSAERNEPEIIQLKPTFAGISIDLKALWRKCRAKREA